MLSQGCTEHSCPSFCMTYTGKTILPMGDFWHTGLGHEECITKMRLMSLVGLATTGSNEVSYALIRDTLKVWL